MNKLSTLANIAEILGVLIVVAGFYFAVLQMRHFRQQRREHAAIELFRFFGNPKFAEAYQVILQLPDGLSAEDIRARQGKVEDAAMMIGTTMENIGVMTFHRIVPFSIVYDLIGSSVIILWLKLDKWADALREELGDDSIFEWFQWLADRLHEHQPHGPEAAYVTHKDWQPLRSRSKI